MSMRVVAIFFVLALAALAGRVMVARRGRGRGPSHVGLCTVGRLDAIRREAGDGVTRAIIAILCDRLRASGQIAIRRAGPAGINFTVDGLAPVNLAALIDRAAAALSAPLDVDGYALRLPIRIGYAACHEEDDVAKRLTRLQDTLQMEGSDGRILHLEEGRGTVRSGIMKELSRAIAEDWLTLHYQPKLDCRSGAIAGVEALLRWDHEEHGPIPPDVFVRVAEETGLIGALTEWVVERALEDQARLAAAGRSLTVFVNMSGVLLPDEAFAAALLERLAIRPGAIGLEITETGVIDDPDRALANLAAFRAAGIEVAIDDYGSGLSSLAYLKQLPATELKIDKLFVSGLTTSHRDPLLVRSSIDLAHALGMKVTAEGVENPMALSLLSVMGCDMAQGYHVARPMPFDQLVAFLATHEDAVPAPGLSFLAAARRPG